MKKIGVGLIGTGYMGKCHALAWNAVKPVFGNVPDIALVHLGEANEALAHARATEFGFAKASGDWRKVIEDPDVDVVSVTTPNSFHAEMAIAALRAGKHLWCEKPMAPGIADAEAMLEAARQSGRTAILGYNYIQNPAIRHIGRLLSENALGRINHLRVEMDEDFMADADAPFSYKHEARSGYGALDDFGVHPLSLVTTLLGTVASVMCDMAKPQEWRKTAEGSEREVETYDIANVLIRLETGASGTLQFNRAAWGRKGRIALQIFGSHGSILFDQERFNEFQLYLTSDRGTEQGFRTILTAPKHEPYGRFIPAPGHGLGFNDLKIIECRELIRRMSGDDDAHVIDFEKGYRIERTVHAMARSFHERRWVDVA